MNSVADPLPNGVTKQDLDDQTAQVQRGVNDIVQIFADRVDKKIDLSKTAFVEQVETVRADSVQQAAQAESEHRVNLLFEKMGYRETATKIEIDHKFNKYFMLIVSAFVLLLAIGSVNYFQILSPKSGQSLFVLSDIRVTGPTDLCPGENLKFEFDVDVKSIGVYSLYMSTWKTSPPPSTIIFSDIQPFVIGSIRSFPIVREWTVPSVYNDPANSKDTPMISGEYIRDIGVIAVGKNTESVPLQIKFNIKDNCPSG